MKVQEKVRAYKEQKRQEGMARLFAERPRMRRERERRRVAALSVEEYRKENEAKHWKVVTEQLEGLQDRLIIVTNFDGSKHIAQDVIEDLKKAGLDKKTVGISVLANEHMLRDRGYDPYQESAEALRDSMAEEGFSVAIDDEAQWPRTSVEEQMTAGGIHDVAEWYSQTKNAPDLNVMVISALNARYLNIDYSESFNGGTYLYRGEDADSHKPTWEQVAKIQPEGVEVSLTH